MKITQQQIQDLKSPHLRFVMGDANAEAYRPWPANMAPPGALVFVSDAKSLEIAIEAPAGIIIAAEKLCYPLPKLESAQALFATKDLKACMSILNPFFDEKIKRWPEGISPLAQVHASAKIGARVKVGPFCVIGENVQIADDAILAPHCVVERDAKIGTRTLLHSFVFIGASCEIGAECELHPHTCIGSDGFGYATEAKVDGSFVSHKIPQLGKVVIEDRVEIGACSTIDRASFDATRVGEGTKLDNQTHLGHNVKIGKNCVMAGNFSVAGSTIIHNNMIAGGRVTITDHVEICDGVTLAGLSVVTKNITEPGAYMGYPLQPIRDAMKTIASFPALPELRKEVVALKREIEKPS